MKRRLDDDDNEPSQAIDDEDQDLFSEPAATKGNKRAKTTHSSQSHEMTQQQLIQSHTDFMEEQANEEDEEEMMSHESQIQTDFFSILREGGLRLSPNSASTIRLAKPMDLRRYLERTLAKDTQKTQEFVSGFSTYIKDEDKLKKLLLPFETEHASHFLTANDSICKLFLNVESLQMNIAYILLEKMSELGQKYGEDAEYDSLEDNIPRLILAQFRWLDMIANCKKLADKIIEVMELCPKYLKKEIILSIPEIVDDSEHKKIAEQLKDIMNEQEYTICVLDALSNLNIQSDAELQEELENFVIDQLRSAQIDDLPVIIRYLLQSANDNNAEKIIDSIRGELDISSLEDDYEMFAILQSQKQKKKKAVTKQARPGESLILEALRTGIRYKKVIEKAFISSIERSVQLDEQKIVDVWVLIVIFSMDNYCDDALRVLKKKIKDDLYNEQLIENSITKHVTALEDLFPVMIRMAGVLLRNSLPSASKFGQHLYYHLFSSIVPKYDSEGRVHDDQDHALKRQDIIKALVTHIGSAAKIEVDAALEVFLRLANYQLREMRELSSFFHSLLDFLENLKTDQLRKIYKFFCILAFAKGSGSSKNAASRVYDELMIIIRKQVSNVNIKYKKMGIIATCQLLSTMGSVVQSARMTQTGDQPHTLDEEELQTTLDVLHTTQNFCSKAPIFSIFFCDELTNVVNETHLDASILEDIRTHCLTYISQFLKQRSEVEEQSIPEKFNHITPEAWMGLNEHERSVVDMLSLVVNDEAHYYERIWGLFAHVKLYCAVTARDSPSETLLMAPMTLFREEELINFRSFSTREKEAICLSLFNAINWMREMVNGYSSITSFETRGAVIERIKHINILEEKLDIFLADFETFTIPHVNHQLLSIDEQPVLTKKKVSAGKRREPPKKKAVTRKTKNDSDHEEEEDQEVVSNDELKNSKEKTYVSTVARKNLSPFRKDMRELNLSIVDVIATKPFETSLGIQIKLNPQCLYYLLQDLQEKLKSVLVSKVAFWVSKVAQTTRITPEQFLEKFVLILPLFRYHMDELVKPLTMSDEGAVNDDPMDDNENDDDGEGTTDRSPKDSSGKYLTPCMQLMCGILTKVIHYYRNETVTLRRILQAFCTPEREGEEEEDEDDIISSDVFERAFKVFKQMQEHINSPETISSVFDVMVAIVEASSAEKTALHCELGSVAEKMLDRKLKLKNDFLTKLIKARVIWSKQSESGVLKKLVLSMSSFAPDQEINDLPSLTQSTFIVFFKAISGELTTLLTRGYDKKTKDSDLIVRGITRIYHSIELANLLIDASVSFNAKKLSVPLISALLKYGKRFVGDFLKLIPTLSRWYPKKKVYVHKTVKLFTQVAKSITHVAYWEKVEKTSSLAKIVPLIRKDIEICYLKIKAFDPKHSAKWMVSEFTAKNVDGTRVSETFGTADEEDEDEDYYEEEVEVKKKKKKSRKQTAASSPPPSPPQPSNSSKKSPKKSPTKNRTTNADQEQEENEDANLDTDLLALTSTATSVRGNRNTLIEKEDSRKRASVPKYLSSSKPSAKKQTNHTKRNTSNKEAATSVASKKNNKSASTVGKKNGTTQPPISESVVIHSDEEEDEYDGVVFEDDEEEEVQHNNRIRARRLSQEVRSKRGRKGAEEDDEDGDVLADYYDEEEEDNNDDGEDLADFIVDGEDRPLGRRFLEDGAEEDDEYSNDGQAEDEEEEDENDDEEEDGHAYTHSARSSYL